MKIRIVLTALAAVALASAHELVVDVELLRPQMIVSAAYGPGEPSVDATVTISFPELPESLSVTGKTDEEGVFSFTPSQEGECLVRVDDGYGHVQVRSVLMDWDSPAKQNDKRFSLWTRAGTGLAVIFGFTAFFMWGRRRNQPSVQRNQ